MSQSVRVWIWILTFILLAMKFGSLVIVNSHSYSEDLDTNGFWSWKSLFFPHWPEWTSWNFRKNMIIYWHLQVNFHPDKLNLRFTSLQGQLHVNSEVIYELLFTFTGRYWTFSITEALMPFTYHEPTLLWIGCFNYAQLVLPYLWFKTFFMIQQCYIIIHGDLNTWLCVIRCRM